MCRELAINLIIVSQTQLYTVTARGNDIPCYNFERMRIGDQNLTMRLRFCRGCVEGNYKYLVYICTAPRKCNQKPSAVCRSHTSEHRHHLLELGNKRTPSRTKVEENTVAVQGLGLLEQLEQQMRSAWDVDMCLCQNTHIVRARSNLQGDQENARINLLFRFHSETEEGKSCDI